MASSPPREPLTPDGATLEGGFSVLLVEDQLLIALDTESMLRELGADRVHAFATVAEALAWLAVATPSIGVLDVSLGRETSFPIADALRTHAAPFIFTTGYCDSAIIPERLLDAPIVRKPYTVEALASALAACLQLPPRRG